MDAQDKVNAGIFMLDAPDLDAALVWAERCPAARERGEADALVDAGACRRYAATARQQLAQRLASEVKER